MSVGFAPRVWTPDSGIPPPPGYVPQPAQPVRRVWTPDSGIPPPPGYKPPRTFGPPPTPQVAAPPPEPTPPPAQQPAKPEPPLPPTVRTAQHHRELPVGAKYRDGDGIVRVKQRQYGVGVITPWDMDKTSDEVTKESEKITDAAFAPSPNDKRASDLGISRPSGPGYSQAEEDEALRQSPGLADNLKAADESHIKSLESRRTRGGIDFNENAREQEYRRKYYVQLRSKMNLNRYVRTLPKVGRSGVHEAIKGGAFKEGDIDKGTRFVDTEPNSAPGLQGSLSVYEVWTTPAELAEARAVYDRARKMMAGGGDGGQYVWPDQVKSAMDTLRKFDETGFLRLVTPDELQRDADIMQNKLEIRQELRESSSPRTMATLHGIGLQARGLLARIGAALSLVDRPELVGELDAQADKDVRASAEHFAAADRYDSRGPLGWAAGNVRGAIQSLAMTVPGGIAGGPAGMIATGVAQQMNQAATEGRDKGLSGNELAQFVAAEGLAEAGYEAALQMLGLGGAEKMFRRLGPRGSASAVDGVIEGLARAAKASETSAGKELAARIQNALAGALKGRGLRTASQSTGLGIIDAIERDGLAAGAKQTARVVLEELAGEVPTELTHSVNRAVFGVDPNAISPEELRETVASTVAQTLAQLAIAGTGAGAGAMAVRRAEGKRLGEKVKPPGEEAKQPEAGAAGTPTVTIPPINEGEELGTYYDRLRKSGVTKDAALDAIGKLSQEPTPQPTDTAATAPPPASQATPQATEEKTDAQQNQGSKPVRTNVVPPAGTSVVEGQGAPPDATTGSGGVSERGQSSGTVPESKAEEKPRVKEPREMSRQELALARLQKMASLGDTNAQLVLQGAPGVTVEYDANATPIIRGGPSGVVMQMTETPASIARRAVADGKPVAAWMVDLANGGEHPLVLPDGWTLQGDMYVPPSALRSPEGAASKPTEPTPAKTGEVPVAEQPPAPEVTPPAAEPITTPPEATEKTIGKKKPKREAQAPPVEPPAGEPDIEGHVNAYMKEHGALIETPQGRERESSKVRDLLQYLQGSWISLQKMRARMLGKNRDNAELQTSLRDLVIRLRGTGAIDVAWDNQGNAHYTLRGTETPEWLSKSNSDADLAKLPNRPVEPPPAAKETAGEKTPKREPQSPPEETPPPKAGEPGQAAAATVAPQAHGQSEPSPTASAETASPQTKPRAHAKMKGAELDARRPPRELDEKDGKWKDISDNKWKNKNRQEKADAINRWDDALARGETPGEQGAEVVDEKIAEMENPPDPKEPLTEAVAERIYRHYEKNVRKRAAAIVAKERGLAKNTQEDMEASATGLLWDAIAESYNKFDPNWVGKDGEKASLANWLTVVVANSLRKEYGKIRPRKEVQSTKEGSEGNIRDREPRSQMTEEKYNAIQEVLDEVAKGTNEVKGNPEGVAALRLHKEGVKYPDQARQNLGLDATEEQVKTEAARLERLANKAKVEAAKGLLKRKIHGGPRATIPLPAGAPTGGKAPSLGYIIKYLSAMFQIPIHTGHFRAPRELAAIWNGIARVIQLRNYGNVATATHEIAHELEARHAPLAQPLTQPMLAELAALDYKPGRGDIHEGFAEYVRNWLTTDNAANLAQHFTAWFEGTWLAGNPALEKAFHDSKAVIDQWRGAGRKARWRAQIARPEGWWGRTKKAIGSPRTLVNLISDQLFNELGGFLRTVKKATGRWSERGVIEDVPADVNFWLFADVSKGTAAARVRGWVENGVTNVHGVPTGPALAKAMAPIAHELQDMDVRDDFYGYCLARHAKDLYDNYDAQMLAWNAGGQKGPEPILKGPMMDRQDVDGQIAEFDNRPGWRAASDGLTAWHNATMDYLVDGGGLTKDVADLLKDMYPHFVSLAREMEGGFAAPRGAGGRRYANLPQAVGRLGPESGRRILPPLESALTYAERIVTIADKARVGRMLLGFAERYNLVGDILYIVDPKVAAKTIELKSIKKQLTDLHADLNNADMDGLLTIFSQDFQPDPKDNIIVVYRNGERVCVRVNDDLYQAMTAYGNPQKLPPFFDLLLGKPKRAIVLGTTALRPGFALGTNPIRDPQSAALQTEYQAKSVVGVTVNMIRALWDDLTGGEVSTLWKSTGGPMSQPLGLDRKFVQEAVEEMLSQTLGDKAKQMAKHPVNALRAIFSFTEAAPRIAEKAAALKKLGWKPGQQQTFEQYLKSDYAAANVTMDFRKGGRLALWINQVIPFFNPNVQDPGRILAAIKNRPVATFASATLRITGLSLGLWWLNKDKEWYKNLAPSEKYRYWHYEVPGTGEVLRLPKPFGWTHIFGTIPEAAVAAWYDEDPEGFWEAGGAAIRDFVPPYMLGVAAPVAEIAMNEDLYFNRPLVSEGLGRAMPKDQYYPHTTETAKWIGRNIGGERGVSPVYIEHLASGWTGGLAMDFVNAAEAVFTTGKPKTSREVAGGLSAMPVFGRFFLSPLHTRAFDDFYTSLKHAEEKQVSAKLNKESYNNSMLSYLRDKSESLAELRATGKGILESSKLSDEEKRTKFMAVHKKMLDIATKANAYVKSKRIGQKSEKTGQSLSSGGVR